MHLHFDPEIQLLKIYTTYIPVKSDKFISLLFTTLFGIIKEWKSPKCPSIGDCLNKL